MAERCRTGLYSKAIHVLVDFEEDVGDAGGGDCAVTELEGFCPLTEVYSSPPPIKLLATLQISPAWYQSRTPSEQQSSVIK